MARKIIETDPDQSERFRKAVADLEADGELSPTGEAAFESVLETMRRQAALRVEGLERPPARGSRAKD